MSFKIYVATSWRNQYHSSVVEALKACDYEVYDFKADGFQWNQIDEIWEDWNIEDYIKALKTPLAVNHFNNDYFALQHCDVCICIMPCGMSAGIELGYAIGACKHTAVYIAETPKSDLMISAADIITQRFDDILHWLRKIEVKKWRQ